MFPGFGVGLGTPTTPTTGTGGVPPTPAPGAPPTPGAIPAGGTPPPPPPGGGTIPATPFTPPLPGSVDAMNYLASALATEIYNSNQNQQLQMSALTDALTRDLRTRPKSPGPPAPKLPNEKHDLPAVFDRTKMDCAIFIRKFRNYFTLIDDAGAAKLTDAQKIHRMVVRLDIQQTEWHTRFEKQLRKQPDSYLQCTDTDNAYTELTFAEFCQQMTANTEVLTADHTHRLQFKEIRLGKLEDPGCFHIEFQRLTDRIDTMGAKDLFYAYREKIDKDYNDYIDLLQIEPDDADAVTQAMRAVEKYYTTQTGKPIDTTGYHSGYSGYLSSVRGTSDANSRSLGPGGGYGRGAVNAIQEGSQRLGAPSYTGCNNCGAYDHYAKDCPGGAAAMSARPYHSRKGQYGKWNSKGKGAKGAKGAGKGAWGQKGKGGWAFNRRPGTGKGKSGKGRFGRGGGKGQPRRRGYLNQAGGTIGVEESGDPRHSDAAPTAGNSEGGPSDGNTDENGEWEWQDGHDYEPYSETGYDYYDGWGSNEWDYSEDGW